MNDTLVSFVLITYNQEKYIADALTSALSQNYSNLQIIVSDDASTDNTAKIIKSMMTNHNFLFIENKENKGLVGNLNHAFSFVKGEVIVVMAGDDISMPNRVNKIKDIFIRQPEISCVYSDTLDIDSNGNTIPNSSYGYKYYKRNGKITIDRHLMENLGILGCSAAFRKSLIQQPLPFFLPSEDKILTLRALLKGEIFFINEKLVKYRLGTGISNNLNKKNKLEYIKALKARVLTIDGYILELTNIDTSEYKVKIKKLRKIKSYLSSSLEIMENNKLSLPKYFFSLQSIKLKDKIRFLYYKFI
ncbi:MAG: glycosyltransferase [Fusobacteriaceae bacterium]|nr:glycosyltransferase [Fusobacteriaceae bacterium]